MCRNIVVLACLSCAVCASRLQEREHAQGHRQGDSSRPLAMLLLASQPAAATVTSLSPSRLRTLKEQVVESTNSVKETVLESTNSVKEQVLKSTNSVKEQVLQTTNAVSDTAINLKDQALQAIASIPERFPIMAGVTVTLMIILLTLMEFALNFAVMTMKGIDVLPGHMLHFTNAASSLGKQALQSIGALPVVAFVISGISDAASKLADDLKVMSLNFLSDLPSRMNFLKDVSQQQLGNVKEMVQPLVDGVPNQAQVLIELALHRIVDLKDLGMPLVSATSGAFDAPDTRMSDPQLRDAEDFWKHVNEEQTSEEKLDEEIHELDDLQLAMKELNDLQLVSSSLPPFES